MDQKVLNVYFRRIASGSITTTHGHLPFFATIFGQDCLNDNVETFFAYLMSIDLSQYFAQIFHIVFNDVE